MAKGSTVFVCRECGADSARWSGQCPSCQAWNSLEELIVARPGRGGRVGLPPASQPVPLTRVDLAGSDRLALAWDELNRVLGGGIVRGSVVLVGGEPGVGKSTLLMHAASQVASSGGSVLYASGEESAQQVRMRAERLGAVSDRVLMLAANDLESVLSALIQTRPALLIVDSIQTVSTSALEAGAGSVSQVRECTARLTRAAKESGVPVILVGHVTKEGAIAGPRVLEHMVDTVLYLEGERRQDLRILRATKNRFGSSEEIGIFAMADSGLAELADPGGVLVESSRSTPGTAVMVALEGSRPLLVEVQSLVSPTSSGLPRRSSNGIELNRVHMIVAVLEKRAGVTFGQSDVYVNVAGGLRLSEPASDLALALSLVSNQRNQPLSPDTVLLGEVGLTGEVRRVGQLERRLQEAERRGYRRAIAAPGGRRLEPRSGGMQLVEAADLTEAIGAAFVPHVALMGPG